jgi:hypothetical protein
MSAIDAVFSGAPGAHFPYSAAANTVALGVDTSISALYLSVGSGYLPVPRSVVAKYGSPYATPLVANKAAYLTYTAQATGLYEVANYIVAQNTATAATLPAITTVFTDYDSAVATTHTLADASTSAAGTISEETYLVHIQVGTTIVLATTSYAAGSGTALAYGLHSRIQYLG